MTARSGRGFGGLAEELVASLQQFDHVSLEADAIDQRADRAERAPVVDDVGHEGAVVAPLEAVFVAPTRERSTRLLVDEPGRPLVLGDPGRHAERDAEVPRLPGHVITELHPAGADTTDDLLTRTRRLRVEVDVEAEVEAHLGLRVDLCRQLDVRHPAKLPLRLPIRSRSSPHTRLAAATLGSVVLVVGLPVLILVPVLPWLRHLADRNPTGVRLMRAGLALLVIAPVVYASADYWFSFSLDIDSMPEDRSQFIAGPWVIGCLALAVIGAGLVLRVALLRRQTAANASTP